jgi:hypothetical protein
MALIATKRALLIAITAMATCAAIAAPQSPDNVVVAHGVLTRNGKAGSLWTLRPTNSLKLRDEMIQQVTFSTTPGKPSRLFEAYEGRHVEVVGQVKSVFHGNAILGQVRTIAVMEADLQALKSPALPDSPAAKSNAAPEPPVFPRRPYRHAYYLFLASAPVGCEPCYVPLLLTHDPLQETAKQTDPSLGVFIVTYERDSIWEFRGEALLAPSAIDAATRALRANGRSYRYQEISPQEVVNLLEHPFGTVPISRTMLQQKSVPGASTSELIADFRLLLSAGGKQTN